MLHYFGICVLPQDRKGPHLVEPFVLHLDASFPRLAVWTSWQTALERQNMNNIRRTDGFQLIPSLVNGKIAVWWTMQRILHTVALSLWAGQSTPMPQRSSKRISDPESLNSCMFTSDDLWLSQLTLSCMIVSKAVVWLDLDCSLFPCYVLPGFSLLSASASSGLFCLSSAISCGLALSISLSTYGSTCLSPPAVVLPWPLPWPPPPLPGVLTLPQSIGGTPVRGITE